MNDHASFSSNPFPDGRLVALNTMSKAAESETAPAAQADHSRVLRLVQKHYTQERWPHRSYALTRGGSRGRA